jgi:ribosomal protein S18 acetylase RimI-like enzyme
MTVLLRTGNDRDVAQVGALHFRSRAAAYAHLLSGAALSFGSPGAMGEWWSERRHWEQDTHQLTVADEDGRVVGFSYVGPSEEPGVAELYAIHVDPGAVGSGVGRLLMVDALERLAALGTRAVLWVLDGNDRARRFYERGGWLPDGTTRDELMGREPTHQLRYTFELVRGSA